MLKKICAQLKSQTALDASLMTFATGISSVLAAVFFILVARSMGPEKLGIFSLATAACFMLTDMLDIALNTSLVRFVAAHLKTDPELSQKYLKFIFKLKLKIGLVIFLLLLIFARPFTSLLAFSGSPSISILIGMGAAFLLIYNFSTSHLQARKNFFRAGIGIILLPALRLLAFILLYFFQKTEVLAVLFIYFITVPLAALFTLSLAPGKFLKVKDENLVAKKFLSYTAPLTLGYALAAVSGRIDNFILANFTGSVAVGFYSAAFRLFTPVQFFAGSLSMVFAPRFASFNKYLDTNKYFLKTLIVVSLLSLLLLLFIPFSPLIIKLFYGDQFSRSVPVLKTLFFGFAALLLQAPFTSALLYYYSQTGLFALVNLIQLLCLVGLNLILIPLYHEWGSSLAFVCTQILVLLFFSAYYAAKHKTHKHAK